MIGQTAGRLFDLPDGPPAFDLSPSAEPKFGHFACNLALQLAGPLKKNPRQIGEALAVELGKVLGNLVERVEVAGPGFLNFHLSAGAQAGPVKSILMEEEPFRWTAEKPLKINLEYVSANPTGPLLVVNGRAAALGSALAEILRAVGHEVTEEFYVNDAGSQVIEFSKSVIRENLNHLQRIGWIINDSIREWANSGEYHEKTVEEISIQIEKDIAREALGVLEVGKILLDEDMLLELISYIVSSQHFLQTKTISRFNTNIRSYFFEHSLYESDLKPVIRKWILPSEIELKNCVGSIIKTYSLLLERRGTSNDEGAVWLKTTDYGDEKDRVIVRSNGKPTYLLTDIAYHLDKWERLGGDEDAKLMIDIWGPDHHGHILPTKAGLQAAGIPPDKLEVLISGWVTLKRGGEIVSMSKRQGNIVTLDELLDEVGVDVARYMFLERSPEAHLDFDLDLAVQQSSENPAYYIQYAHARIASIFAVAREEGFREDELGDDSLAKVDLTPLFTDDDAGERQRELLRQIVYYPGVVAGAAASYAPQRVTAYLHSLAGLFHPYYKKVKVLVEDRGTALARLALSRALRKVLAHGLGLLGISAPESM
ncbi:MAG: arginine--tRNA ligase [Candidatus Coatesbacteria bacterium RBG_13_66_14]|uniref:Arginine--tRNA ligase n=1 Tax=Candidatus Coatesbacteria bacterium RBG_13_66_14 TaxID=1817816 RepID=A0A1F5EYI3_9BACT|nr:MAG: arginine--tRNA ligase [Candidatus Coatesbacteria bacterium RBG_13_66_14]